MAASDDKKGPQLPKGLGGAFEKREDAIPGLSGAKKTEEDQAKQKDAQPPPETAPAGSAPSSFVPKAAFSPLAPPTLSLPKGGGAIRGIGETLRSNPATGTAGFDIPLPLTQAPHGPTPQLRLAYDSGQGNGVFGLGWAVGVPQITRKTDKRLPAYRDSEDSDIFLLSGAEDLVPMRGTDPYAVSDGVAERYRPRTEGLYAWIERITKTDGTVYWRTTSRDHTVSTFGSSDDTRIVDPDSSRRVFSWLLEKTEDALGHVVTYLYKAEDFVNVNQGVPSEAHRRELRARQQNKHLKRVRYGNTTMGDGSTFKFDLVLDYGEHDPTTPTPDESRTWAVRQDPFSSYRAGFEMRTYRLCQRVLMFHTFIELSGGGSASPVLVRSLDLTYGESPLMTKLAQVTSTGYVLAAGVYTSQSMPPVVFTYQEPVFTRKIDTLETTDTQPEFPRQLLGQEATWVDLDGEGIAGVLTHRGRALHYQRNLGEGKLGAARRLPITPALSSAKEAQLTDVAGSGTMSMVVWRESGAGYHERLRDSWGPFRTFTHQPKVDRNDPNLKLVDLNGDGFADILIARGDHFLWYPSEAGVPAPVG